MGQCSRTSDSDDEGAHLLVVVAVGGSVGDGGHSDRESESRGDVGG